jgi:hypothetical protein
LVVGVVFVEGKLGEGLEVLVKTVFVQTTFVPQVEQTVFGAPITASDYVFSHTEFEQPNYHKRRFQF